MRITAPVDKKRFVSNMVFEGYGIELRPVTPRDLPTLRRWRNSPQISQQMRDTSYITPRQQRLWYERIKNRDDQAHWVAWRKGVRAGYVNIKSNGPLQLQEEVDVGLYVGDSSVRHGLLGYAMTLMQLDIAFEHLSVSRIQMVVKEGNYRARRFNQQLGYREEGYKDGFVKSIIYHRDYQVAKARLIRYFRHD
jgi:RimJ/RimL family protein N-acetyltransferase